MDPATDDATLRQLAADFATAVFDQVEARYHDRPDIVFDAAAADRAADFFPRYLRHTSLERVGTPLVLLEWQRRMIRIVFGYRWVATGRRVVRRVYLFVARKNGKSTFAAGLALLLLVGTGQQRGQVISAAADAKQAGIVFGEAAAMVAAEPALSGAIEVYKEGMQVPALNAGYRVLSGTPKGKHGLNPHAVLFDELHEQSNRDLHDALTTATGAQPNPLHIDITTAGYDRHSICWEVHEYARRVRDGVLADDEFLPVLFEPAPDDDWRSPATWAKANPSIGEAIQVDYLRREAQRAMDTPGYQNTFRRLHCNEWTEQSSRWLDIAKWDASAGPIGWRDLETAMRGRTAFAGLDLAKVRDLSAFVLAFPPDEPNGPMRLICRFWCPADDIVERSRRDRVPYDRWAREGLLTATEGNVTDFAFIKRDVLNLAAQYNIREIGFDRTFGGEIVQDLMAENLAMVQVGQGHLSMAAPTAEVERLVLGGLLHHGGHPILRWMAANVSVAQDAAGNLKPDKAKSSDKIDGISALCNALARQLVAPVAAGSIYDRVDQWDAPPALPAELTEAPVPNFHGLPPNEDHARLLRELYGVDA
jgi:phage terminase large subunit-like protein